MFAGEHINTSEDRAVGHVALRRPRGLTFEVDGADVMADVHHVLDAMGDFARRVRRAMADNYKRRARIRRYGSEQAATDAMLRTNRRKVSLRAMSRLAGNCQAGTEAWLARLGIQARERATAGAVYRLAKMKGGGQHLVCQRCSIGTPLTSPRCSRQCRGHRRESSSPSNH